MYDRFYNPSSQRWIKTDSRLAKSILKHYTHDTVMNPKSMKLISAKSSVGRSVLNKYRAYAKGGVVNINGVTARPELAVSIDQATDQDLEAFQQCLIDYIQGMFDTTTMKRGGANPLFQQVIAPIFGFITGFLILMQNGPQNDQALLYIQDYVKDTIQSGLTENAVHLQMHTPYDRLVIESTFANKHSADEGMNVVFAAMMMMFFSFLFLLLGLINMLGNVLHKKTQTREHLNVYMQHLYRYKDVLDTDEFKRYYQQIKTQNYVFDIKPNSTSKNRRAALQLIADIYTNTDQPRPHLNQQLGNVHNEQKPTELAYSFVIQPDGTPQIMVNQHKLTQIQQQNVLANHVSEVLSKLIAFDNALGNS